MNKILLILFTCISTFACGSTNVVPADTTKKKDTLNILISETNHIYYYDEPILPDASNFISTVVNGLSYIIGDHSRKLKGRGHQLMIFLKIQKQSALNEDSKKAIGLIKKENYIEVKLNEIEKQLIKLTEEN